eukprot:scaffold59530_cov68-Phaeocystis_antarctica.AAC.8
MDDLVWGIQGYTAHCRPTRDTPPRALLGRSPVRMCVGRLAHVRQSKLCIGAIDARFQGGFLLSTCSTSLKFSYKAKPRELDSATCQRGRAGCSSAERTMLPAPRTGNNYYLLHMVQRGRRRHLLSIASNG